MKKSMIAIIVSLALISIVPGISKADDLIPVYINGEKVNFEEQPFIEDGSTLVPFRSIFEKLGLTVSWNDDAQAVIGTSNQTTVELQIGKSTAKVNGILKELSVAPKIVNGSTFVPLRFVGEATGRIVKWDEKKHTVFIRDGLSTYLQNTIYNNSKLTYKGDLKDNQKNGHGSFYSDGKLVFEGEFKDNKIEGTGILYWQGGQKLYKGQWSKGYMNGAGKLYKEDGTVWYDNITMVDNNPEGTGTLYYTNGPVYKGELVHGEPNGQGKFFNKGQLYYEGQVKSGLYDGKGKTYYSEESVRYEGEFQGGWYNGQGTLYNADGSIRFQGTFKDGKPVPKSQ
jgi:hypothetical protein